MRWAHIGVEVVSAVLCAYVLSWLTGLVDTVRLVGSMVAVVAVAWWIGRRVWCVTLVAASAVLWAVAALGRG